LETGAVRKYFRASQQIRPFRPPFGEPKKSNATPNATPDFSFLKHVSGEIFP
jgi:hypothetical protein